MSVKPLSPEEVTIHIPDCLIIACNEALKRNFDGEKAVIRNEFVLREAQELAPKVTLTHGWARVAALMEEYKKLGWEATISTDQNWWELSKKKEVSRDKT